MAAMVKRTESCGSFVDQDRTKLSRSLYRWLNGYLTAVNKFQGNLRFTTVWAILRRAWSTSYKSGWKIIVEPIFRPFLRAVFMLQDEFRNNSRLTSIINQSVGIVKIIIYSVYQQFCFVALIDEWVNLRTLYFTYWSPRIIGKEVLWATNINSQWWTWISARFD